MVYRIKRRQRILLLSIILVLVLYQMWNMSGRKGYEGPLRLNIKQVLEYGKDGGTGNILTIHPWMLGEDYSSKRAFKSKLDGYFHEAERRKWLRPNTVVLLPEYLGAWLLCANEKSSVWSAPTVEEAMKSKILSSAPQIAYAALFTHSSDRLKYAIFKTSAIKMSSICDETLSSLARKYHVTIVGGSIILPSPSVVDGRLKPGNGPLFNVSPVYRPDGKVCSDLVTKTFLTADEKGFLSAGDVNDLPVFNTPIGIMGVLICADSWFPDSYTVLRRKGAEAVVVPSFIVGDRSLDSVWHGYSGWPPPKDVRKSDINKISSFDAWKRYALPGRLPPTGIQFGVMACLRGHLWNLGSDSCIFVLCNAHTVTNRSFNGAALINIWVSGAGRTLHKPR